MTDEVQVLQLKDPTVVTKEDIESIGRDNLVNVVIPEGVTEIGWSAFEGCKNLEKINIPDGVIKISGGAFKYCENLKEIAIPGSVTKIDESAFEGCKNLKEINIPDSVTAIGWRVFSGCENLKEIIIPASVTEIANHAFEHCENLKEIAIPDSVTEIGKDAFSYCKSLEKINIPDGVATIYFDEFSHCENLKEITIPDSVTKIGEYVFQNCPSLQNFIYKGHVIQSEQINFTESLSDGLDTLKCLNILAKSREILNDEVFSPILVTKLCQAEHNGTFEQTATKIQKDFNTIGFYEISSKVDIDAREKLIELFKNNTASRGVVPKIIDALTIASTTLNIEPEKIVHAFEDKKFRDAIIAMRSCHKNNHFFDVEAVLFAMTFDVNEVKNVILENPYKDYASVLLCDGYKNDNEKCINAAKWIVAHPNTSKDIIDNIFKYKDYIDISPEMTVDAIKTQFSKCESQLEIKRIESEYSRFHFEDCVCNLQKTEVELGKYKAYIMDGQDPRQVMLGYDTDCCQHLGGAGETAMMYGLTNPNAGFWVIEDKETGKILAQAECWETGAKPTVLNLNQSKNLIQKLYDTDILGKPEFPTSEPDLWKIDNSKDLAAYLCSFGMNEKKVSDINAALSQIEPFVCLVKGNGLYQFINKDINMQLIFDNIEFADDRQIDQFAPIIAKWGEASPYENILMGNGYNEMVNSEIREVDGIEPPVCEEYTEIVEFSNLNFPQGFDVSIIQGYEKVDFSCYDEVEEFKSEIYERLEDLGIIICDSESEEYYSDCIYGGCGEMGISDYITEIIDIAKKIDVPYTDADKSCSLLKIDSQVEPYFIEAYQPIKEAEEYFTDTYREDSVPKKLSKAICSADLKGVDIEEFVDTKIEELGLDEQYCKCQGHGR